MRSDCERGNETELLEICRRHKYHKFCIEPYNSVTCMGVELAAALRFGWHHTAAHALNKGT